MNLIEKAIRYSPEGEQIYVNVEQMPPSVDDHDDGLDMPLSQIEQIGQPLLRSSFQNSDGAGLGFS